MKSIYSYYISILVITILFSSSCKVLQPNRMLNTDDISYSEFKPSEVEYRIKPYDKISVSISTNDGYRMISINENAIGNAQNQKGAIEFMVEFDGQVKLPTLGRINIAGRTIREAEKLLEEKLAKHYQNPFVLLQVVNRRVYVFKGGGQVGMVIQIPEENLTLIEAIAQSGGLLDSDKAYRIKVIRGNPAEEPQVFLYNIRTLTDLKGTNLQLEGNDIIYVESRPRYVRRVMNELTPYLALLSTVLLIINLTTNGK
ncbi:MAG: polysaccharide biosynthesis/export family protein [Salinivirgaceae bacterium]|nr:polysaccharide biosynthesis/export family protein [Salinivirgaceae bacterium]MDD4745685.1 polysaccharide biosynthesis/export family protein [Salinivirgaceae bacterium]MDY0279649.1 polysaccharide biosynthesis/export family protein [Salinivirgaceae bacterium]